METTHRPGPKEVVLQLFVIATLYAVAVHVGILFHQLVNAWVPDTALDHSYGPFEGYRSPLRYAVAMLVVFVPIHAWARRAMHRLTDTATEVRALRSRRWLGYITIAIAGLILAGDLVAVIHKFLDGEFTLRFVLKALSILCIAAAVLWYERAELRRGELPTTAAQMRIAGTAYLVIVAGALVAGFIAAGTPAATRRAQLDQQRVNDLQNIQWRIVETWQQTGALPTALDTLRDEISGFVVPLDPVSAQPYEYHVLAEQKFELCATFTTISRTGAITAPRPPKQYMESYDRSQDVWMHGSERTCFLRTIDPLRYPVKSPLPKPE